ncbi:unnamed protein product [Arctia plantaginis]|uniref:Uncharacterized protein n=1 Tax=Arctia plantaginis TaxID=874455 RepID=A0A8S1BLN7_ARCPL|nr:unnamed protein product [Arctia plantaginis]
MFPKILYLTYHKTPHFLKLSRSLNDPREERNGRITYDKALRARGVRACINASGAREITKWNGAAGSGAPPPRAARP